MRVFCLGDSLTAGYGVRPHECWRALAEREAKRAQNLDADVRRSAEEAMRRVETYEKRKGLKAPSAERAATYLFDDTLPLFKITERHPLFEVDTMEEKQRNLRHHAGFAGCRRVFQFCSAGCFTCFCALPAPWRA